MKPVGFDYYRPQALSEAVALLSDMGDEAAILAGGMTTDAEPESRSPARGHRHITHVGAEDHFGTIERGADWRRSDTERRTGLGCHSTGGSAPCNGTALGGPLPDA